MSDSQRYLVENDDQVSDQKQASASEDLEHTYEMIRSLKLS